MAKTIDPIELAAARRILKQGGWDESQPALVVVGALQRLFLLRPRAEPRSFIISTGKNGFGNLDGSGCTPTGLHRICASIGQDQPQGMVFKARVPTGEVLTPESDIEGRDLITTRILWLDGLEPGINQGEGVDSRSRFIYIHGTPHAQHLGTPASAGCIRMADADVEELSRLAPDETLVLILPG